MLGKASMTDSSALYDMFEAARRAAMALTDKYYELAPDDPQRAERWQHAMQQTDSSRRLLEAWLQAEQQLKREPQRELVLA